MNSQLTLPQEALTDASNSGEVTTITPDLAYLRLSIVNVVFYGRPGDKSWVLVDAGLLTSKSTIIGAAEQRFGKDARPSCIIMTHAHFDHAGSVMELAKHWEVPVYAHSLEMPFLDGSRSYPAADVAAGGGTISLLAPLFPRGPVDVRPWLAILPEDGYVPHMEGWQWVHTPGHTPGHVSLWRASDRTLIAGDAVVTTGQESVYEVIMQTPEMHGPPRYFTPDWAAAERSVATLASLEPKLLISGHGTPAKGQAMLDLLHKLSNEFREIAVPPSKRGVL